MKYLFVYSFIIFFGLISIIKSYSLQDKKFLTDIMDSLELEQSCEFLSHVISVDTKIGKYDLLMSYSTNQKFKCKYNCVVISENGEKINAEIQETNNFANQVYSFLKFSDLKNYIKYNYICSPSESNKLIKDNGVVKGDILFPKNKDITKIITFGDWSKTKEGSSTRKLVEDDMGKMDALVFLGDQGYDMYENNGVVGNEFLYFVKSVTSKIPYQITTGNHETKNNFEDLKKRFIMPNKKASNNLYYSYNINNVHFVSLNSEIPYKFNEEYKLQFQQWLRNDLKLSNKKWKVVFLHRPLYCSQGSDYHCITSSKYMREILEEILLENKVDLVLTGHVHAYERLYPIYNNKIDTNSLKNNKNTYLNPKYPTHMVCGAGGNKEGFPKYEPKENSKIVISKPGICEITFEENKIISNFISSETKKVLDNFEIIKN